MLVHFVNNGETQVKFRVFSSLAQPFTMIDHLTSVTI